jgi:hypothetical protein
LIAQIRLDLNLPFSFLLIKLLLSLQLIKSLHVLEVIAPLILFEVSDLLNLLGLDHEGTELPNVLIRKHLKLFIGHLLNPIPPVVLVGPVLLHLFNQGLSESLIVSLILLGEAVKVGTLSFEKSLLSSLVVRGVVIILGSEYPVCRDCANQATSRSMREEREALEKCQLLHI